MTTGAIPEWQTQKRDKYDAKLCDDQSIGNHNPLPGVTFISDLLKVIDVRRQTGYTNDDLPKPFDVPKSYAHVPHQYLAADGFPKSEFWLQSECRSAIPPKEGSSSKYGKGRLVNRALDGYRAQGLEGVPEPVPCTMKTYSKAGPRRAKRSKILNEARSKDQSPDLRKKTKNTFDRSCDRLNDPVLPFENYDRTMEIISNLYTIVDHGSGQFVDRQSKELIFTFSFEDLEACTPEEREAHQKDVSTILMSTKLFRKLPTPKKSPPPTSRALRPRALPKLQPKAPEPVPSFHNTLQEFNSADGSLAATPSPLTSLPPSDSQCIQPFAKPLHCRSPMKSYSQVIFGDPPSSPLTSLPPSDSEPVIGRLSSDKKRKVELSPDGTVSKRLKQRQTTQPTPKFTSRKHQRKVTTNAALIHGNMYCFGQTVGYSRDILMSSYMPKKGVSRSLYQDFLDRLPDFGKRIGSRFKSFCDEGFQIAHQLLIDLNAPPMASTSKAQTPGPLDFAANFAFTFGNFYNKPHTDNDKGKVYCLWYPIDIKSGKIVTFAEGFLLEGGWFIFPEYRVAINFGNKYAVQIAWNGKSTFHHTIPSKEKVSVNADGVKVHCTRLGCSSQITYKMAVAAGKIGTDGQFNHTSNCERDVRDAEDILALADRNWKP